MITIGGGFNDVTAAESAGGGAVDAFTAVSLLLVSSERDNRTEVPSVNLHSFYLRFAIFNSWNEKEMNE